MIFILKVTTNKEERAMEMIHERTITKQLQVFSIARPHGLKGYLILEAANRDAIEEAAFNLPYVKGIIGKTVTYDEVKNMIQPEVQDINIEVGDIVEMIADHFKNEKGKITRIDKKKGEVVVSLLGAAVPIPVTVKIDNVRVIRRESQQAEEENADN
ncbi:transcription elongation factor Spt5 [Candidatus Pacearchaeota archaeon]|nr:transcription elongation factor Spt5 [Candidatus Pacearchaeota archaeon]